MLSNLNMDDSAAAAAATAAAEEEETPTTPQATVPTAVPNAPARPIRIIGFESLDKNVSISKRLFDK